MEGHRLALAGGGYIGHVVPFEPGLLQRRIVDFLGELDGRWIKVPPTKVRGGGQALASRVWTAWRDLLKGN